MQTLAQHLAQNRGSKPVGPSATSPSRTRPASLHILSIALLMSSVSPVLCSWVELTLTQGVFISFSLPFSLLQVVFSLFKCCLFPEWQLPPWSYFFTLVMPIIRTVQAAGTSAGSDPLSLPSMHRERNREIALCFRLEITIDWPFHNPLPAPQKTKYGLSVVR